MRLYLPMVYTVNKFHAAVVALATLALCLVFPMTPYFVTGSVVLPALYANTILVVLNARIQIQGGRGYTVSSSPDLAMVSYPSFGDRQNTSRGGTRSERTARSTDSPMTFVTMGSFDDTESGGTLEMKAMRVSLHAANSGL